MFLNHFLGTGFGNDCELGLGYVGFYRGYINWIFDSCKVKREKCFVFVDGLNAKKKVFFQ